MKTTLNIGLENNTLVDESDISRSVERIVDNLLWVIGNVSNYRVELGEYDGEPERTLIVELDSVRVPRICLDAEIQRLCDEMSQECIAYVSEHVDHSNLVYSSEMIKSGLDTLEFNSDYFLNF